MNARKSAISIWYMIGLLLTIYGIIIGASGVYEYFHPPAQPLVLAKYHSAIWWGGFMFIVGLFYALRFRTKS